MARIIWNEEKIKEWIDNNSDYEFIKFKKFDKVNSRLILKCSKHGEFEISFAKLKQDRGCRTCSYEARAEKRRVWTQEKIIEMCKTSKIYNFIKLVKFDGRSSLIEIECKKEKHRRTILFESIINECNCHICENQKTHNDNIEVINRKIQEKNIDKKVKLLEIIYYNTAEDSLLLIECKTCNHIFTTTYSNLIYTPHINYCKECAIRHLSELKSFDIEYIKEKIEENNYKLLSNEYKNNTTQLLICCDKGHEYTTTYQAFHQGERCPICNQSKGEKRVGDFLMQYNIVYKEQYRFNDCRFKKPLPFDFYLSEYNILIEYDGEYHYKFTRHKNTFDKFVETKIRDTIKNIYCQNNNIKLIRIPYWDFDNIESILIKELNL